MYRCNLLPSSALWLSLLALTLLSAGCADDSPQAPGEPAYIPIEDGVLPEVVVEGESASIEAWGTAGPNQILESLEVDVVSSPRNSEPGRIDIRAIATEPTEGRPRDGMFGGSVSLPPLVPGEYVVHFVGRGVTRNLSVLPTADWVRYRSHHDPMMPDEGLLIHSDGKVIAYRDGSGRTHQTQLDRERIGQVRHWFQAVEFNSLESEYLSGEPNRMRVVEISLQDQGRAHRVIAEQDLMPDRLARIANQLHELVDELIRTQPPRPQLIGKVLVDPVAGDPGTIRHLGLVLVNEGNAAVTLRFPTAQQFDFSLLRTTNPNGDDHEDPDGQHDDNGGDNDSRMFVWNWSHGRTFPDVTSEIVLQPGETKAFRAEWNGLSNRQERVGPGVYVMNGIVTAARTDLPIRIQSTRLVVNGEVPHRMPLVGTLSVDPATAPAGTDRKITFSVTNLNKVSVDAEFLDTQRFDLAIHGPRTSNNDSDRPIWLWSFGMGFGDEVRTETWEPGETRTYVETWNGRGNQGEVVMRGHYSLAGWITSRTPVTVRPVSIVVSN